MWYAMQIQSGLEDKIIVLLDRIVKKGIIERCFVPKKDMNIKIAGEWKISKRVIFPGYVFIITNEVEKLLFELKKVPQLTQIISDGYGYMISLVESDINILKSFENDNNDFDMGLSNVRIEGNKVIILDGPLLKFKDKIKKFNLHKRYAVVTSPEFMNGQADMHFGINIV